MHVATWRHVDTFMHVGMLRGVDTLRHVDTFMHVDMLRGVDTLRLADKLMHVAIPVLVCALPMRECPQASEARSGH